MSTLHPTADQIDRYRNRSASAEDLILLDAHIAGCDRCHAALHADAPGEIVVGLPREELDHLTYDEMEQWIDGRCSDVNREIVEGHIAACVRCREELADLDRARKDLQPSIESARRLRSMKWLLPAAAMVAIVAGGTWVLLKNEPTTGNPAVPRVSKKPPPAVRRHSIPADPLQAHVDDVRRGEKLIRPEMLAVLAPATVVLRGSESGGEAFALLKPVGTLVGDPRPEFRWTPMRGASSYTIAILDVEKSDIAARGTATKSSWRPSEPLERSRTYTWQVTSQLDGRVITAPRPPAPQAIFGVASGDQVGELKTLQEKFRVDHLALGVVLAERGFLDEAERELRAAARSGEPRANELLAQVNAWREPRRP